MKDNPTFYSSISPNNFVVTTFESHNEDIRIFLDSLSTIIANPDNFIDKGGAAQVFSLDENFCVKIIENRHNSKFAHMMNLGNDSKTEARILAEVNKNSKISSPKFIAFITGNQKYSGIIMRNAKAINLQKFILGRDQVTAKNFDIRLFIDKMYEQTQNLQDMGYCHNDLEARNWMIDTTGMPVMIDFGRTYKIDPSNPLKNGDKDWEDLEVIEKNLSKLMIDNK